MKLKKISLENIRSYKNQEVEFTEGSTLLSGDIGSGKTSILLGIEFALFGLQPGQRGHVLLRNGEDYGKVIINFEVENKDIIIERTLKRGKTISQDKCSITINGEKTELSVSELKNKILCILNYPREFAKKQNILYKFTVYTPQEEMKQIILQDSETRINTLRHVFGIDKYKRILENVLIIASKLREERRLKEGITLTLEQDNLNLISKEKELEFKTNNLSLVEEELLLKIKNKEKFYYEKQELAKKIEEKNKLQQEIEKTKLVISTKQDILFSNEKFAKQIQEQIIELEKLCFDESKLIQLEKKLTSDKKEKEKLSQELLEINSKINSFNSKIEECKKLEQKISNLEVCPTCLQDVDAVYRANVLNKTNSNISKNKHNIEKLEIITNKILRKITEINSEISFSEKQIKELEILKIKLQGINEKKMRLNEIKQTEESLRKDISFLMNHKDSLENSFIEFGKFNLAFETKQKQLEEAIRQEKLSEIKVAELKKEIEVFSKQITEIKEALKKAEEIRKKLDYITELENWLSKKFIPVISFIEKNVMVKLKSEFSKLFTKWFGMLVSDSFEVYLSDDFTPVIEQQDYELDYAYISGGERTAIALAYRLALNQVINSLLSKIKTKDLIILDEPTDGFSEQQLDKIRDVLQELNVKQLIIVSHEQKIEGFVENVVKLKKEAGVSGIE